MVQIQQNTGLSNNRMRKLGSALNQISPVRLVEPSFPLKFAQAGQKLHDQFIVSSIALAENKESCQVVSAVSVKPLNQLEN